MDVCPRLIWWSQRWLGQRASLPTYEAGSAVPYHGLNVSVYAQPPHQVPTSLLHFHNAQMALVGHDQDACL